MTRYIVIMTHRTGWTSQLQQEFTSRVQAEMAALQLMSFIPGEYRDYEIREIKAN